MFSSLQDLIASCRKSFRLPFSRDTQVRRVLCAEHAEPSNRFVISFANPFLRRIESALHAYGHYR